MSEMDEDEQITRALAQSLAHAQQCAIFVLQYAEGGYTTSPRPTVTNSYTRVVTAYLPDGTEACQLHTFEFTAIIRIVDEHRA